MQTFRGTAIAVLAFGIAFGYLEASVVVYLRAAVGAGVAGPPVDESVFAAYAGVEILREVGTLVMIATVGWLAGRTWLERLAWAAVIFGTWDIVYYAGLRTAIGWPASLADWDVLFLVPRPWVGPIWAPVVVSSALIGVGLAAARRLRTGAGIVIGRLEVLAGLGGGLLVIGSFLVDTERVYGGDLGPWSGWPLFWAGMAAASLAAARGLRWPSLSIGRRSTEG